MKIKVFSHLTDIGNYKEILSEQISLYEKTSLIDNAEFIFHCNYNPCNFDWLKDKLHDRNNCYFVDNLNRNVDYDFPTLIDLKNKCDESEEEFYVLYTHLKGVTHSGTHKEKRVADWRNLMQYFNIEKWKDCVGLLDEGYETVGVNYHLTPFPHYSGNYWWAKSSYIKKLPKPELPSKINFTNQFISGMMYKYEVEMWIGMCEPKYYVMHESNVDHYYEYYPSTIYR